MRPFAHIEVGAQRAVDVQQQVQVEGRRHAQRVVVSGLQFGGVFDQIHPYQQAAARRIATGNMHAAQKAQCVIGREVANAGARIKQHAGAV